jgi:hypothetical protein
MELKNGLIQEEIDRSALGRAVVEANDPQQGEVFRDVFGPATDDADASDEDDEDDDA